MNEKIRELCTKAGMVTQADFDCNGPFAEKLAELIIKECHEVANDNDWNWSCNADSILDHFGMLT